MGIRGGFFRGSEQFRFLILVAILVVGWPLVFFYYARKAEPESPPAPVAERIPLPPADDSLELHGVQDKARLTIRDNPGYGLLLNRSRLTSAPDLAAESRRDVPFLDLIKRPDRFRGLPIHVEGTAYQIEQVDDVPRELSTRGRLYEAWIVPKEQQIWKHKYPYCVVFEEPPEGLPGGRNLGESVGFDGYFFKLLAYDSAEGPLFAPMFVGRLGWSEATSALHGSGRGQGMWSRWWVPVLVGLMIISLLRFGWVILRHFKAAKVPSVPIRTAFDDKLPEGQIDEWLKFTTTTAVDDESDDRPR